MRKFCNSMVCEGHLNKLRFVEARWPSRSFYIMKREELEECFFGLLRENKAICSYCDKPDSSTCVRFIYIKRQQHLTGVFLLPEIDLSSRLLGKFMTNTFCKKHQSNLMLK